MGNAKAAASWIVAVVVVAAVVVAGVYLVRRALHPAPTPSQTATLPSASATAVGSGVETPIQHPVGAAQIGPASASTAPLPALDDSDKQVAAALSALAGGDHLRDVLVPRGIIARMVATIDALPRHSGLGVSILPAQPPKGTFLTADGAGGTVVATGNADRYAPYMTLLENTDPKALVAWYVHAYPLFQEAYRQLGYPKGYFNDRVIIVIDDLLAAPDLAQPAVLQRSKSYYIYADPALEALSTGQKMLLRLGPANETRVKAKLRVIRASLLGRKLPAAPVSSSAGAGG